MNAAMNERSRSHPGLVGPLSAADRSMDPDEPAIHLYLDLEILSLLTVPSRVVFLPSRWTTATKALDQ